MPQFVLQGSHEPVFRRLDAFTQAYITAAFFADLPEDAPPSIGFTDLAPATLGRMAIDCAQFQRRARPVLQDPFTTCSRGAVNDVHAQAGHDFWLTRQGHGAGFWDGDWSSPASNTLDELAKSFGSMELYVGDDGKIYL